MRCAATRTRSLTDMPVQRSTIEQITGRVDVHVFDLERVRLPDNGGEHLMYLGWLTPPFPH